MITDPQYILPNRILSYKIIWIYILHCCFGFVMTKEMKKTKEKEDPNLRQNRSIEINEPLVSPHFLSVGLILSLAKPETLAIFCTQTTFASNIT